MSHPNEGQEREEVASFTLGLNGFISASSELDRNLMSFVRKVPVCN